ncbi:MAG TPA: hypothetical protein PLD46_03890 [Hyphomicrobium sp.]|nr:hypothetical protein [Hyphomicrobium sp.]
MTNATTIDPTDVPMVDLHDLYAPLRRLIADGRGLALLNGMSETEIRAVESQIWADFADEPQTRLAVALRFRALLEVFKARRLRQEFLLQGFKLITRAVAEASTQRLNTRFGFAAQKFVNALAPTAIGIAQQPATEAHDLALAA